MAEDVPLIVPEVNSKDVWSHKGIVANPNCSTIQAVLPLKVLDNLFGIKRIVYSTYQAVSGSGVALVTPFTKDKVDYSSLEQLIEWHIENKTDAIIICGTTGEASTLTDEEKREVISFTVNRVNNRIPVIAGTGSNNTRYAIELSKCAEGVGTDGILVVTPYYNKTTPRGLVDHFATIASSVSIPTILYNVPSRTGVNIPPDIVEELSQHPNIRGIKEASGNISQVAEIARLCPKGFYIYAGNDDMIVPLLSLGGI